jgi:predicted dehydrogenase
MQVVKIGIIGLGTMGTGHAQDIFRGDVPSAKLVAICDTDPKRLNWAKENFGEEVLLFNNSDELFAEKVVDAVIIATPHYDHPTIAIKAFKNGLHVLCEKPAGVYTKKVREMNEAAEKSGKVFSLMYQVRTIPVFKKVKDLIDSGELGELKRTNWIITNWYRPQSYYNSGSWRATWEGEGGGVLINQCPHQLDLWQWICGMPVRVQAHMGFGRYHDIEVEDDVTAYVEYENGATGVFITSTADSPGTNRLEITGDMGKIIVEENKTITFFRNRVGERKFNAEFKDFWGMPECWKCEIPVEGASKGCKEITANWVDSILKGTKLIAPGVEGINGLTLSNAMHLSSWIGGRMIEIPFDEDLYYEKLKEKIASSTFKKTVAKIENAGPAKQQN